MSNICRCHSVDCDKLHPLVCNVCGNDAAYVKPDDPYCGYEIIQCVKCALDNSEEKTE